MTTNICVRYCYDSDIWMDYPKLISEKWNLTAKFNCLDGHYLMCHLHYVSLCVLCSRCAIGQLKFQGDDVMRLRTTITSNGAECYHHLITKYYAC